ncbi:YceI family protein [Faecalibacter sp. LW9]|uniref:YceI family protein n=1 Tax=Faecalibacter sp. LW9 TaxID=3103144 RepID=UPI002AFFE5E4|nr:YceI family protein [Faecalibacter sp. LW9]
MKKLFGVLCAVGVTASILSFNHNEISDFEGTNAPDLAKSHVTWKGTKFDQTQNKDKSHNGTVKLKDAKVRLNQNTPEAVSVTVDLANMTNFDLPENMQGRLISHLQSADFFDISVFPDATFTSTKITKLTNDKFQFNMEGNITIKGISKPLSVNGHIVTIDGKKVLETEKFALNGEEFGFIKPGGGYKDVSLRVQIVLD